MKRFLTVALPIGGLICALVAFQGCSKHDDHDGHDHGNSSHSATDSHEGGHTPKYNEVLVEFPGHKYAMEITDNESTGLVTAYLTDAHFATVEVDAKEVTLNFIVGGGPKTYTLPRATQETGKPATFSVTDKELAVLICDGWKGDATASVAISGTPYNSKLTKLGGHDDHDHSH